MATAMNGSACADAAGPAWYPASLPFVIVAYLCLCAVPLLNDTVLSWVVRGTGAIGVPAYVAAWSAVVSLGAISIAVVAVPVLLFWLLRNALRGASGQHSKG
ncbi:hypothetical protein [Azospirillum sp.]|uniref:hypothetical protein n=1 Tax=Azospirillum sp. TaxID=34012 RepID=UPI002D4F902A|nr:hypothetical protein [Azospirillum sp.]HYD70706.1 hypothetical protein [Azospirillum sp.]